MSQKLFLTSSVCLVARDIASRLDLTVHNKLVFITTPAETETGNLEWQDKDRQSLVDAGFDVTEYTITGKQIGTLGNDLMNYDYIYVSGGDTAYFLKEAKNSGFNILIKDLVRNKGKIYISTSAGSIAASQRCQDYWLNKGDLVELGNITGLGFVNFLIIPHWGSDYFREKYLHGRLEVAYKPDQIPLIALTDNQYVYVDGEKIEIVVIRKGEKTE